MNKSQTMLFSVISAVIAIAAGTIFMNLSSPQTQTGTSMPAREPTVPANNLPQTPLAEIEVKVSTDAKELTIFNITEHDIYFTFFDSEVASRTEWAPMSSDANRIEPAKSAIIKSEEYADWPSGKAIAYWWLKDQSFESVKSVNIKIR